MVSQPQRYLILFVLGLLIGVVATVFAMRAWRARQDPMPGAIMHVMAHQTDVLRQAVAQNRCAVSDTLPRLQALRMVGNDIESAFSSLGADERFIHHASQLRATLDGTLAVPVDTCQAAQESLKKIDGSCQACHNDFEH